MPFIHNDSTINVVKEIPAAVANPTIEPDKLIEFDWRQRRVGRDRQLEYAIECLRGQRAEQVS
jgi:hypothetical protein